MEGGAWWATVHGVTKSRTRLSEFTSLHLASSTGTCCVCGYVCVWVWVCVCMWICVGGYVVESISFYFHFPLLNIFLKLSIFWSILD